MEAIYYVLTMIASVLISASLAPKPAALQPAAFEDFNLPTVDEGTPQAVVFGECWSGDWQVIGKGDYRTEPVRTKSPKK